MFRHSVFAENRQMDPCRAQDQIRTPNHVLPRPERGRLRAAAILPCAGHLGNALDVRGPQILGLTRIKGPPCEMSLGRAFRPIGVFDGQHAVEHESEAQNA